MQQPQVGFDPISINHQLPWQTKVFILYLFIVGVLWLVRSVKLSWQLGLFSPFQQKSTTIPSDDSARAHLLVTSALANKLPGFIGSGHQKPLVMRLAAPKFYFLWETCWMSMASMKRLARLTFLAAIFVFVWLVSINFLEVSSSKITGIGALSGIFAELFGLLTTGMAASLALYVTSGFYEAALTKRKVLWNYIYQKSNVEIST